MNADKTKRRPASLDSVDLSSPALRTIRSPRSLQALRSLGLGLQDLLYVPISAFRRAKLSPDLAEAEFKLHEGLRLRRVQAAVEARKKLLADEESPVKAVRRSVNADRSSNPLTSLQIREERQIKRLEQRKKQALMQSLVLPRPRRSFPASPKLSISARQTPALRPVRPAERPSPQLETSVEEVTTKKGEKPGLLETLKERLQARALLAASKVHRPTLATHSSTPTHTTPTPTASFTRLELRAQRHTQAISSLATRLELRRQEKETSWLAKRRLLQHLEATHTLAQENQRKKLISQHQKTLIRLKDLENDREMEISLRMARENAKIHRSKRRKSHLDQLNAQRASADLQEYLLAERKSVEIRQNRVETLKKTGELREYHRELRRNEAERVQKVANFRRKQTLERITEEEERIGRLKRQKDQEMLRKQQLMKQFETQKQLISERFERLETVKGHRLAQSLHLSARKATSVH